MRVGMWCTGHHRQWREGYHFTERMVVRKAGAEVQGPEDAVEPAEDDGLNERQRKILEAIDSGAELRQKDVIAMFRRNWNPSTVKREIRALRDAGSIETHADGHYVRTRAKRWPSWPYICPCVFPHHSPKATFAEGCK